MKKYFNFLFITGILLIFLSCDRNVSCPEFDNDILRWVPYHENDVIELYTESNNSILAFSINSIEVVHKTGYSTRSGNSDCGTCDNQILVNQDAGNFGFQIFIDLYEDQINLRGYQISDTYFTEYNSDYSEQTNFQFGNTKYEQVWIFEKENTEGTFKKLIVAKGVGVAGLVDVDNNIWIFKEKTNKSSLKQERIKITNVSCG